MSKKTENIFKTIENLQKLQNDLAEFNKTADARELSDIEFNMGQDLKKLKLLIESLYSYNGKSTSYAKRQASKENGKKGGRPPKEITQGKKRLAELEELIPDQQHKLDFSDDSTEHLKIEKYIEELEREKSLLAVKLAAYYNRDLSNI